MGQVFYDFARGVDHRPVISEWERKSVSCERTFESDISQTAEVNAQLDLVISELVRRIAKSHFQGYTLTLKVKFHDFQQITRSITVPHLLLTLAGIQPLARQLMNEVDYRQHPIRLLGLGVSNHKEDSLSPTPQWQQLELHFLPWPDETC
jgi:DNA polymerase-4